MKMRVQGLEFRVWGGGQVVVLGRGWVSFGELFLMLRLLLRFSCQLLLPVEGLGFFGWV